MNDQIKDGLDPLPLFRLYLGCRRGYYLDISKGIKTIQAIAKEFDLHPMQVSEWKRKLQESLPGAFEKGKKGGKDDFEAEREKLQSKIGQLTIELDFVIKKSKQLGL